MTTSNLPPIDITTHDWALLLAVLQAHVPTCEVWAFGSRARHTAKPYSDLDIAVIAPTPLSLRTMADLVQALEASDMSIRTDVVDWASTQPSFQQIIQREHIVIQTPATPHSHP